MRPNQLWNSAINKSELKSDFLQSLPIRRAGEALAKIIKDKNIPAREELYNFVKSSTQQDPPAIRNYLARLALGVKPKPDGGRPKKIASIIRPRVARLWVDALVRRDIAFATAKEEVRANLGITTRKLNKYLAAVP